MQLNIQNGARLVLAQLHSAGYAAYVVGGAVRDLIMGVDPADYDITTSATPDKILSLFDNACLIGGSCGTVCIKINSESYEVTPMRTEGDYNDARHPSSVGFCTDIHTDLARRDFTVNAIAYDGKELIDDFNGIADIKLGVLRCVGDTPARFNEDALRILRLFRFAAQLSFDIEPNTLAAALQYAPSLLNISCERIRAELQKTLLGKEPHTLAPLLFTGALKPFGFGEPLESLIKLDSVPCEMLARWWALLQLTASRFERVCVMLGFSKGFLADLHHLSTLYAGKSAKTMRELKIKFKDNLPMAELDVINTFAALDESFALQKQLYNRLIESKECYKLSQLALSGQDLMAYGIYGKRLGASLSFLLDTVIRNPQLNNREALLNIALEFQNK